MEVQLVTESWEMTYQANNLKEDVNVMGEGWTIEVVRTKFSKNQQCLQMSILEGQASSCTLKGDTHN